MRKKKKIAAKMLAGMTAVMLGISPVSPFVVKAPAGEIFDASAHGEVIETGSCGRSITYTLYEDGTLYLAGKGKMSNYNYFDNKSPFSDHTDIYKAIIEEGITSIGTDTFYECQNLEEIVIPTTIASVGELAFDGTPWLKNQIKKNSMVIVNGMLIDGKSCSGAVKIPEGVTKIAEHAFEDNQQIISVTVPEGVVTIEDSAFCACRNLLSVTLPDSLTGIGTYAFSECQSLVRVAMPKILNTLDEGAFSDCYALQKIQIPSGLKSVSPYAFWMCSSLQHVTIPEGTTTIGSYAFANCSALQTVTVEKAVTIIKEYAFTCCDSLRGVALPGSVRKIDDMSFYDCLSVFTIYGEAGSEAEAFAKAHKIPFSTEELQVPKEEEKENPAGDVNGSGRVQLDDAQLALKAALKIVELDEDMKSRADIDGDGKITLADAQKILKIALKIID